MRGKPPWARLVAGAAAASDPNSVALGGVACSLCGKPLGCSPSFGEIFGESVPSGLCARIGRDGELGFAAGRAQGFSIMRLSAEGNFSKNSNQILKNTKIKRKNRSREVKRHELYSRACSPRAGT